MVFTYQNGLPKMTIFKKYWFLHIKVALQDAPKTTPGRPQLALGPSEGQPLDRPRATLICKNQYNF